MVTTVYYHGNRATYHKHGLIVPGTNRLDSGIADKLLTIGFVTTVPVGKGNPFQDKEGKFSTKEDDADGKRRYKKPNKKEE